MRLIWIRLFGFDMVYENQPSETISQICDRARVNDRCALRHRSCALIARDFCSRDLCKTQTRARAVIVWYDDHHRRYAIMMMMIIRWRCWCGTIGLNIRWHCRSFVADKQHIKSVHRFRARTHHRYLWITPRDWHGCASQEKKTREWRIRYIYSYINIVLVGHHPGEERRVVNAFNHMWYIYIILLWYEPFGNARVMALFIARSRMINCIAKVDCVWSRSHPECATSVDCFLFFCFSQTESGQ